MKRRYPYQAHFLLHLPLLLLVLVCLLGFKSEADLLRILEDHRNNHPGVVQVMTFVTHFCSYPFYVIYLCFLIKAIHNRDRQKIGFVVGYVVSLLLSLLLVRGLKLFISRPRPPVTWEEFAPFTLKRSSCPSSHVTESLVTITPLMQRYGGRALPLLLGCQPVLVGVTRLYLGRHYPSDFLGSIVVGVIAGAVAWWIGRGAIDKK